MDFFDVLRTRRSIRAYKNDPVPAEAVEKIKEAIRLAPTGCNFQPFRFVFITDEEVSRVVHAIKENSASDYSHEVMEQIEKRAEQGNKSGHSEAAPPPTGDGSDEMLAAAV